MKFIHAADIHLDSPLLGLERYEGAPVDEIRGATRHALENLVTLCLDERAAFLLIAGDLYDGGWRDYHTGQFFARQVTRLREADIPVFLISGNHDAASVIPNQLRLPENARTLSTKRPETVTFDEIGVAIHGQGFATREVPDDLSAGYPRPLPGYVNIGLLHTSADGREGHATYAPCSPADLAAKGYDYWALGHVHQREVLCEQPWIVFPGNLQGRHARETGGKGATVVTVEDRVIQTVEHRDIDVVRWTTRDIDAGVAGSDTELFESVEAAVRDEVERADGRLVALRVRIVGATSIHGDLARDRERLLGEVRQAATDIGGGQVWVEKVDLRTTSTAAGAVLEEGAAASLLKLIGQARATPDAVTALASELTDLARKLPPEVREGADGLDLTDPDTLATLAAEAEALIVARLLGKDGAA